LEKERENNVLLGFDVLKGDKKGAVDILLSKNKIVLDGYKIPCFQVGKQNVTRKVVVAEDFTVPGLTEALVNVFFCLFHFTPFSNSISVI
jgi:hypothetical protein